MPAPPLPPVVSLGLYLLDGPRRRAMRALAEGFVGLARELETLILTDGALYRNRLMALHAQPPFVERLGLPAARVRMLLDGLNLYFARQRHRDRAQFDAVLHQTGGVLAELGAGLLGAKVADAEARKPFAAYGRAVAQAELLLRLRDGLAMGRVHAPDSEIERFNVDLAALAGGRTTPQILDLLWSETKHARAGLDAARAAVGLLPEEGPRRFAGLLLDRQAERLRRLEAAEYRYADADLEIRGLDAARMAWRARRTPRTPANPRE